MKAYQIPILILFLLVQVTATDYYVSNAGGDSNNGCCDPSGGYTDCQGCSGTNGPWRTISKVNTELNGGVISQGDNIYFKRGNTFTGHISVTQSGASISNPLIFGAYGTGDKPIIDATTYGFSMDNKDYITIQDLRIEHGSEKLIEAKNGCSYITIDNCEVTNAWDDIGIFFTNGCNHIILRNTTVWDIGGANGHDAVGFYQDCDYVLVEGCDISDATHSALQIRGYSAGMTCEHFVF